MLQIREVKTESDYESAMAIQARVFVDEQGIPGEQTLDAVNKVATHVLAFRDGSAIGTARMEVETVGNRRIGTLARIAVVAEHRKGGCGKQMVNALEQIGLRESVAEFVLRPHEYLERFYASMGYVRLADGDHQVAGHALITMRKRAAS